MLWEEHVEKLFANTMEKFKTAMVDMESEWQFPFAFSAIDGPYLPFKCSRGGSEAMKQYYNFKKFYSIIVPALVDARYYFTWVSVGTLCNTHDSTYFQSTDLWNRIEANLVISDQGLVKDLEIPPLIMGDGTCPLRKWIAKPYGDAVLSEGKRYFNYRGSMAKMETEGVFAQLKSRFRSL